jgi:hypothetical protein
MFRNTAITLVALLALTVVATSVQAQFRPAIGPPTGPAPTTPGSTVANPFPDLPVLTGTWKGQIDHDTYVLQPIASGYSVHSAKGLSGVITRKGNYLYLTFGSGSKAWTVWTGIWTTKSNSIGWGFPPPDGTSWQMWKR